MYPILLRRVGVAWLNADRAAVGISLPLKPSGQEMALFSPIRMVTIQAD